MATYAIGDIQGCYDSLQRLLELIQFDPAQDRLWLAGDLVNRGPDSLAVLRFAKQLEDVATVVLGNHDLHLLAVHMGGHTLKSKDTLQAIFDADDGEQLLQWLRHQPLLHCERNWCMTHAGLPPQWSIEQAQQLAREVEHVLRSDDAASFLAAMYGNQPDCWQDDLEGIDRQRSIVNYLTRMRFVDAQGRLNLDAKEGVGKAPDGFAPWFSYPRQSAGTRLLFGHWAALEGRTDCHDIFALDTGCVWGGQLSALRLDDQQWFRVSAHPLHQRRPE